MSLVPDLPGRSANRLLSTLPPEEYVHLRQHLSHVSLSSGQVLADSDRRIAFAYFPTTAVISLTCALENGASTEIALTGNDGVVPTAPFLGGDTTSNRAIVGVAGDALRIATRPLNEDFARLAAFQRGLLKYTEALITQISITAACNRVHTLERRLCRWLLLVRDRISTDDFFLTQEFIANMLGGRRETVTVAAGRLQDAGLIHYTRGKIRILDRKGLEQTACECYRTVNTECMRILAPHRPEAGYCIEVDRLSNRPSNSLNWLKLSGRVT